MPVLKPITRRATLGAFFAGSLPVLLGPRMVSAATGQTTFPGSASTVNVLDYIPPELHAAIRRGTIAVDLSSYYARAFAASASVKFPAGTYTHASYALARGSTLLSDGKATVFKQLNSARPLDSIFVVAASDVTIADCTLVGIIHRFRHTDKAGGNNSEFNHGISIVARKRGEDVRNVRIGNLTGRNLRGDVVAIHCEIGATLDGVSLGDVFGDNVLRNGVSIVGGRNISIGAIAGTAFGYAAFDIEPEGAYSTAVENVRVRSIRAAVVQLAANPDTFISNVTIDRLDTDPRFATTSTPPYRNALGRLQRDTSTGLRLRNVVNATIGSHRARGHAAHAVGYFGDASPRHAIAPRLEISHIDYAAIGAMEATYFALIQASGMRHVTIGGGSVAMAHDNQRVILGGGSAPGTSCIVDNLVCDGMIAAYVKGGRFSRITMKAPGTRGFALGVEDSEFNSCKIAAGYLGYNVRNCRFNECDFALASGGRYVLGGASANNRVRNSRIAGVGIRDERYSR